MLPKEVRKTLGLKPGDKVFFIIERDGVRMFPRPENYAEYMYGLGREVWEALGGGDKFFAEERASWE